MIEDLNQRINFGQYGGLSVKEIYQGTLNLDKDLIKNYLDKILNEPDDGYMNLSLYPELIERFDLTDGLIKIIGDIHDPEKTLSPANRIVLGNIQKGLSKYIDQHFDDNSLGTLLGIKTFNKTRNEPLQIGADPEYLGWWEREIDRFHLSNACKRELEKLLISRFRGIHVMYVGQETYEYAPQFVVETYKQ